jgi:hypothetical protein
LTSDHEELERLIGEVESAYGELISITQVPLLDGTGWVARFIPKVPTAATVTADCSVGIFDVVVDNEVVFEGYGPGLGSAEWAFGVIRDIATKGIIFERMWILGSPWGRRILFEPDTTKRPHPLIKRQVVHRLDPWVS